MRSGLLVLPGQHLIELIEADQPEAPEDHREWCLLLIGLADPQSQGVLTQALLMAEVAHQGGGGNRLGEVLITIGSPGRSSPRGPEQGGPHSDQRAVSRQGPRVMAFRLRRLRARERPIRPRASRRSVSSSG